MAIFVLVGLDGCDCLVFDFRAGRLECCCVCVFAGWFWMVCVYVSGCGLGRCVEWCGLRLMFGFAGVWFCLMVFLVRVWVFGAGLGFGVWVLLRSGRFVVLVLLFVVFVGLL